MGTLDGKVAIVTGAGQGLGEAYARALAGEGATSVIFDVQAEKAAAVAADLNGEGKTSMALTVDVSDRAAVKAAVDQVVDRFGRVDILINNAASGSTPEGRAKPWYELPQRDWDRALGVNVSGSFYCCCAVAPSMIAQNYGKVVNVATASYWGPSPHLAGYVSSKGGVIGLTRALAVEFGPANVTVNAVSPGLTVTPNTLKIHTQEDFQRYAGLRSISRVAEPKDIVGTVLYLCSPASDFVTGQVILVEGGHHFI